MHDYVSELETQELVCRGTGRHLSHGGSMLLVLIGWDLFVAGHGPARWVL